MRAALISLTLAVALASTPKSSTTTETTKSSTTTETCASDFDCSLNGVCQGSSCVCDSPWVGDNCATLGYKVSPASGKDIWGRDPNLNSWNGPILQAEDGLYHFIVPVYEHASLWNVIYIAHGVASDPSGPYDYTTLANISHAPTINPGGLVFPNASAGNSLVYSIWIAGDILTATDANGPYVKSFSYPGGSGGNPAPAYHNGAFYLTDQSTTTIHTTPSLDQPWTTYATIPHTGVHYAVEDPTMYFDIRGNIHIINHAYDTSQRGNCTASVVSSHFFSADGKVWGHTDQPYSHTVQYDDGTTHSYCTLERPGLVFDKQGLITHINLAADLITQNEGCASRGKGCVDVSSGRGEGQRTRTAATGSAQVLSRCELTPLSHLHSFPHSTRAVQVRRPCWQHCHCPGPVSSKRQRIAGRSKKTIIQLSAKQ
jgi:hypothetical protein